MKAIRVHEFGGPEVLRVEEAAAAAARPGQMLVRVCARSALTRSRLTQRENLPASDGNPGLPIVFLSSLGRGLISSLGCVLLGHVFALSRRAVKTRAFPVVNTCLGVNPHLAMASAGRGRVSRFLGRAPCRRWSCGRTRCLLSLRFLGSGFCFRRSRW